MLYLDKKKPGQNIQNGQKKTYTPPKPKVKPQPESPFKASGNFDYSTLLERIAQLQIGMAEADVKSVDPMRKTATIRHFESMLYRHIGSRLIVAKLARDLVNYVEAAYR